MKKPKTYRQELLSLASGSALKEGKKHQGTMGDHLETLANLVKDQVEANLSMKSHLGPIARLGDLANSKTKQDLDAGIALLRAKRKK